MIGPRLIIMHFMLLLIILIWNIKVLIHAPDVYPETSLLSEVLQPGKVMSLAIDPHHVESEENVKDLKLSQRTCLFSDEVIKK